MKIAHISDLHLNTLFTDSNLNKIKFLLKYIISQNPDHVVITGDLTDNADESDLIILRKLFKKYDLLDGSKCSLVIGNHDIFGGPQKAEDIFSFPERCKKTDYNNKVNFFNEIFKETFDFAIYRSVNNFYPFAKLIGKNLLVGLNSVAEYSRLRNSFASNGEISLKQFNELTYILNEYRGVAERIIILVHHHFHKMKRMAESSFGLWQNIEKQTMKLRKKSRLFSLFNKYKVDLILHGHTHHSSEYFRKGLRFLNNGASIKNLSGKYVKVNFISFTNDLIETTQHKIDKDGNIRISKYGESIVYVSNEGILEKTAARAF